MAITLLEIANGYFDAAERLRRQLRRLRQELRECEDVQRRGTLRVDINRLAAALTDCRNTGIYLLSYYERRYVYSGKRKQFTDFDCFCSGGRCRRHGGRVSPPKGSTEAAVATGDSDQVNRQAAAISRLLLGGG